jgi:hypothetical protein
MRRKTHFFGSIPCHSGLSCSRVIECYIYGLACLSNNMLHLFTLKPLSIHWCQSCVLHTHHSKNSKRDALQQLSPLFIKINKNDNCLICFPNIHKLINNTQNHQLQTCVTSNVLIRQEQ